LSQQFYVLEVIFATNPPGLELIGINLYRNETINTELNLSLEAESHQRMGFFENRRSSLIRSSIPLIRGLEAKGSV
jgi:hypothetical protein